MIGGLKSYGKYLYTLRSIRMGTEHLNWKLLDWLQKTTKHIAAIFFDRQSSHDELSFNRARGGRRGGGSFALGGCSAPHIPSLRTSSAEKFTCVRRAAARGPHPVEPRPDTSPTSSTKTENRLRVSLPIRNTCLTFDILCCVEACLTLFAGKKAQHVRSVYSLLITHKQKLYLFDNYKDIDWNLEAFHV